MQLHKHKHEFTVTQDNISTFIGFLMSGYQTLPGETRNDKIYIKNCSDLPRS